MEKKFYICGERPVIVEDYGDYDDYLAFDWETGEFKQNFRYAQQVNFDPDGDVEEISESEFIIYVEKLKKKLGL